MENNNGNNLRDLPDTERMEIEVAALLHDVWMIRNSFRSKNNNVTTTIAIDEKQMVRLLYPNAVQLDARSHDSGHEVIALFLVLMDLVSCRKNGNHVVPAWIMTTGERSRS